MHVPDRIDVCRVDLPQHARHLFPPQNESCVSRQLVTPFRVRLRLRQAGPVVSFLMGRRRGL